MRMPRPPVRRLTLITALIALLATLIGSTSLRAEPENSQAQLPSVGRTQFLAFVTGAGVPPPPPTVNTDLSIRPVPLSQVQRGNDLSVEYRFRNNGSAPLTARFSLFYPQRLINFEWLDASADRYISHDATRVIVEVRNVAAGETRVGRINFLVFSDAAIGSRIGLYGEFACATGPRCQSNFAEIEVIRNSDEGSGGTFTMAVSPDRGPPGTAHTFSGSRFRPGETFVTWLNTPTGVTPLSISGRADSSGRIQFTFGSGALTQAGFYSMVAHGQQSGVQNVGPFIVQINGQPAAATAGATGGQLLAPPVLAAPALAAAPAQTSGSGGISGRVVDAAGTGIAGVAVLVRDGAGNLVAVTRSNSSGFFLVASGLATGPYTVVAKPEANPSLTLFASATAGPVQVTSPELTRDVSLTLPAAGGLTGTVTGSGAPAGGVRVSAIDAGGAVVQADLTDATGTYSVTNLPAGSYTLRFDPQATPRSGLYNRGELTGLTVTAGQIGPVAAFALTPSTTTGELDGRVTDAATGAGLEDVFVVITRAAEDDTFVSIAKTAADGSYSSDPLPAGSYEVEFVTHFSRVVTTTRYIGEFYNDAASIAEADPVAVTAGASTVADAGLALGASIGGTVTGDGAGALNEVVVVAVDEAGAVQGYAISDAAGAYSIGGLRAGTYDLEFFASLSPDAASRAFYDGEVADVVVSAGAALSGVNVTLNRGAQIVGTVSASDTGEPLNHVLVVFFEAEGDSFSLAGYGRTDASGAYSSPALTSGSYRILYATTFSDNVTTRTYRSEYFSNQGSLATATPVLVPRFLGAVTRNVELDPGGGVRGRVSAEDTGEGLGGVFVIARVGDQIVGGTSSDEAGSYSVEGLPAGSVQLTFEPGFSPDPEVRAYGAASVSATVTAGAETTQDVALSLAP